MKSKVMIVTLFVFVALALSACPQQDGPAENAGEKVDEAIEDAGDAVEDATDT